LGVLSPLYNLIGIDSANFAGMFLSSDMGAWAITESMTENPDVVLLSGLYLAMQLGITVCFTIPVALGIITDEENKSAFSRGVIAGIIATPFGAMTGGLFSGMSIGFILKNLSPAIVVAALLVIGLAVVQSALIKGFIIFAKVIRFITTVCFGAAIFQMLTGIVIIPGMTPISEALALVAYIGCMMGGALGLVYFITKVFRSPIEKMGNILGINGTAAAAMLMGLAQAIPIYGMVKDMDPRGKVIAIAFSVPSCYALGGNLSFVAVQTPDHIAPFVFSKLAGGIVAVVVAMFLVPKREAGKNVTCTSA
jgi:ethanolamine transporter